MERLVKCNNVSVLGVLHDETYGEMPLLELHEQNAAEWNRLCRKIFLRRYIRENGHAPADLESAYRADQQKGREAYAGDPEI